MSSLLAEIRGQEGILSFHQKTVGCSVELTGGKKEESETYQLDWYIIDE